MAIDENRNGEGDEEITSAEDLAKSVAADMDPEISDAVDTLLKRNEVISSILGASGVPKERQDFIGTYHPDIILGKANKTIRTPLPQYGVYTTEGHHLGDITIFELGNKLIQKISLMKISNKDKGGQNLAEITEVYKTFDETNLEEIENILKVYEKLDIDLLSEEEKLEVAHQYMFVLNVKALYFVKNKDKSIWSFVDRNADNGELIKAKNILQAALDIYKENIEGRDDNRNEERKTEMNNLLERLTSNLKSIKDVLDSQEANHQLLEIAPNGLDSDPRLENFYFDKVENGIVKGYFRTVTGEKVEFEIAPNGKILSSNPMIDVPLKIEEGVLEIDNEKIELVLAVMTKEKNPKPLSITCKVMHRNLRLTHDGVLQVLPKKGGIIKHDLCHRDNQQIVINSDPENLNNLIVVIKTKLPEKPYEEYHINIETGEYKEV